MHEIMYCSKSYSVLLTACKSLVATLLEVFTVLYWPIIIPLGPIVKSFSKSLLTEKNASNGTECQNASD